MACEHDWSSNFRYALALYREMHTWDKNGMLVLATYGNSKQAPATTQDFMVMI